MQTKIARIAGALLLPVLLLAALVLFARPSPADAQSGVSNFTTVSASRDVLAGRDVMLGGFLTLEPAATLTVTNNGFVTPTTTLLPLAAAATVGISGTHIAVQPAGTLLVLLNVGAQTITFTETETLVSAGNIALGAGDSATLVSNGTNYYQIAASNN